MNAYKNIYVYIAIAVFAITTVMVLPNMGQLPLDSHAFRQTQTALSAYWISVDGWSLDYQTPVAGMPWSIPMEFPIYQLIVGYLSRLGVPIVVGGRATSYIFFLLCMVPIWYLTKLFKIKETAFFCFVAIFMSSPVYINWGRAFMIETTALFFGLCGAYFYSKCIIGRASRIDYLFGAIFMALAFLQKVTTAIPIWFVLSVVLTYCEFKRIKSRDCNFIAGALAGTAMIVFPLIIGDAWVNYSDFVKTKNEFGSQITSAMLWDWNFGSLADRFSSKLYIDTIWKRVFSPLGGALSIVIIVNAFLMRKNRPIVVSCIAIAFVSLFSFTNLHIVHDYYQTSFLVFVIIAISISISSFGGRSKLSFLVLIALVFSNYYYFSKDSLGSMRQSFGADNKDYAIGSIVKKDIPKDGQLIVYGNDWSSTIAFLGERKTFTVPDWFKNLSHVKNNPNFYLENGKFLGLISCSEKTYSLNEILMHASKNNWRVGESNGCYISTVLPSVKIQDLKSVGCKNGNLDEVSYRDYGGIKALSVKGWAALSEDEKSIPDQTYAKIINNENDIVVTIPMFKSARLDVNSYLGISPAYLSGYSLVYPINLLPGAYTIEILQRNSNGSYEFCNRATTLMVK